MHESMKKAEIPIRIFRIVFFDKILKHFGTCDVGWKLFDPPPALKYKIYT